MFRRPVADLLSRRLSERRRFLQVVVGPRQVGKTTLARQVVDELALPSHYASADGPLVEDRAWLEAQWERARIQARSGPAVLVLDEIQKVRRWSDIVKRLWDEDTAAGTDLRTVLLGSAPLLIQQGLTESLAGRFETVRLTHWSLSEMEAAFGWGLDEFLYFGAYPGAAPLAGDSERWVAYVRDSLIETTVTRDILLMTRVDKPALLRRVFDLACACSGQVLSYQKMLGQLQDAGNTTTLAHYLELLSAAGMVGKLEKYAGATVRRRASSPKLQVLNTALMTVHSGMTFEEARSDPAFWGRLAESAVGAHLLNSAAVEGAQVTYWRERNREVDFIVEKGRRRLAIEVGTGFRKTALPGFEAFAAAFGEAKRLLVAPRGIPIETFLRTPLAHWLG